VCRRSTSGTCTCNDRLCREESNAGQGRGEGVPRGRGACGGGFASDMRQHVGRGAPQIGGVGGGGGGGCKLYANNLLGKDLRITSAAPTTWLVPTFSPDKTAEAKAAALLS
jgi:hypothetical protein